MEMKRVRMQYFIGIVFCLLTMFGCTKTALMDDDLTYTISIVPVENQIDKSATYYDLLVKPGMKQTLGITVKNTGTEEKEIRVSPTNAITNQNGVIDYSVQPENYTYDKTLTHPFTSLVGPAQVVKVPAGESKVVNFELNVPNEAFKGMILGGFVADIPDKKEKDQDGSGVKIVNKFQLVKAVRLQEDTTTITPELVLNDVKPNLIGYRTAVTANLQNTQPVMFGQMQVVADVTEKGKTEKIKSVTKENLQMAPNSNFDFPIMWENKRLDPGEYTLHLVATSGDKKWEFTKDFTIKSEESKKLNSEAVELEEKDTPYLLYLIVGLLSLLIVLLIIFLVLYLKKKKVEK